MADQREVPNGQLKAADLNKRSALHAFADIKKPFVPNPRSASPT
jgi:hypothetical protein